MRKIRKGARLKAQGVYTRSDLILFVLEKRKFLTRMFDTHSRTRTSTTTRTRRRMTTKAVAVVLFLIELRRLI